jgi:hypothetical protein
MKRAGIAIGMVVVLVVALGGPVSAAERRRTEAAQYRGHSSELECRSRLFDTGLLEEPNRLTCGTANTAHSAALSERTRFRAPSWARSVQISISDDSGDPVGFRVYFDGDTNDHYRFTNSSCVQRATLNLRKNTRRISVARILGGCGALHTTGVVKAAFSSRRTADPSPRNYVSGCGLAGVLGLVGFDSGSCSYRASKAGGYIGVGLWSIEIVRGGETIRVETIGDPPCSQIGFIRAGDRVAVRLVAGYVAAGDNVHC